MSRWRNAVFGYYLLQVRYRVLESDPGGTTGVLIAQVKDAIGLHPDAQQLQLGVGVVMMRKHRSTDAFRGGAQVQRRLTLCGIPPRTHRSL